MHIYNNVSLHAYYKINIFVLAQHVLQGNNRTVIISIKMATTQGEIRVGPGNQVKDIYVR